MNKSTKKAIRQKINSNFTKELRQFKLSNGFTSWKDVAEVLGKSKYWLYNFLHEKNTGVRTPTDVDIYNIANLQRRRIKAGMKLYYIDMWKVMTDLDEYPGMLDLKAQLAASKTETNNLKKENDRLKDKIKAYEKMMKRNPI